MHLPFIYFTVMGFFSDKCPGRDGNRQASARQMVATIKGKEEVQMARGQRKPINEQLAVLDASIQKLQVKMDALKKERASLLAKKKEEDVSEVLTLLQKNGMSVDDIKDMVKKQAESSVQENNVPAMDVD